MFHCCFKGFQVWFTVSSRIFLKKYFWSLFLGCFKLASALFQGCFKWVLKGFSIMLKGYSNVSRIVQPRLKDVSYLYIMRWFVPDSVTLWGCLIFLTGVRPWLIRRWLYSVQYSTCVLYTQQPPNVYTQPPPRRHFPWGSFSTWHSLHRGPNRG